MTEDTRKLRCLLNVEHANGIKFKPTDQCPNERLPGTKVCAHHLAELVNDYGRILEENGGEAA
jgi:hypothetical protein